MSSERDWHSYNEALMRRGELELDSSVVEEWNAELKKANDGKVGEPSGCIGIDVNERNVTTSDTLGETSVHDTSRVAEIKERYRAIRAKIGEKTKQDRRISQKLYTKYGKREKNRTVQAIHLISKKIVERAKKKNLGIVMEKLKGTRKLYRKWNGQGAPYRGRMNSWTFHEIQRQIEYKAGWEGIPITYVSPRHTSRNCSYCGTSQRFEGRMVICPSCGKTEDRDVNASKNIMMAAQVRAAQPPRGGGEGEPRRQEKAGNPPSGGVEVSLGDEPKI
jgi:putative transposase